MPHTIQPLVDHFFRHESGKLVALLTRTFGTHNLALAEDVVQDTLLKALEHWRFHGPPQNPSAWLYTVARNKALDVLRRQQFERPWPDQQDIAGTDPLDPHTPGLEDEQLRMMFVCAHPNLSPEGQVALMLKTLCGFSVREIARAFMTSEETIQKRLFRAREKLREQPIAFALPPPAELQARLDGVLTAIYLLFNEGYHATETDHPVREELVEEALRLALMLVQHQPTAQPAALALLALLCFQAARLATRQTPTGELLALRDQDRTQWNAALINRGLYYLNQSSHGEVITTYHIEAAMAYEHCRAASFEQTNWARLDELYTWLMQVKSDPVVALNHAVVKAERFGPAAGLDCLAQIEGLELYALYHAARADWLTRLHQLPEARAALTQAIALTNSPAERKYLSNKLVALGEPA